LNLVNNDFISWQKQRKTNSLSSAELKKIEKEITNEVLFLKSLSIGDQLLYQKKAEVTDFIQRYKDNQNIGHIHYTKRMIWRPKGKTDFRRIEPELILVRTGFPVTAYDIWGAKREKLLLPTDPYRTHWDILRTLVSRAPNNNAPGVNLSYLVVDKVTRQYLGVIRLSSAAYRITPIFNEIGFSRDIQKQAKSKLNCVANGQTIVPTQPFGSALLGGKLCSLLCLSKQVAHDWEENNGFKLVSVHTTSLYGSETGTQYSGLDGYWNELSQQTKNNSTVIELTKPTYKKLKQYLEIIDPERYWATFHQKSDTTGMNKQREAKTQALHYVYRHIGLTENEFLQNAPRGIYSSFLYKNAKEYLRGEIDEAQLIPAFDNSVEALTDFWRFGQMGDTTSLITQQYQERLKQTSIKQPSVMSVGRVNKTTALDYVAQLKETDTTYSQTKTTKIELRNPEKKQGYRMRKKQIGMVKGRLDFNNQRLPTEVDWYFDLPTMTWDEIQKRYGNQFSESKTD